MFTKPAVFVDIETTGIGYKTSRIIEVAAIRVESGQITQTFHSLINPGIYLPEYISSITGIYDKDLIGQPYFEDIADQLLQIFDGAYFVAHNVRFDYSFIKNQLAENGHKFNPPLICTVRLSRALYPKQRRHSLEQIINTHDIKVSSRHRALDDTQAILDFCKIASTQHGQRFDQAINKQLKHRAAPPNISNDIIDNLPDGCGVYIFDDADGNPLYIGKSINIKKRVMSHFADDSRSIKEMKLSLGVHNIRTIQTASELEALLLESNMIKDLLPLHNRMLRRVREYTAIIKTTDQNGYINLSVQQVDLNDCDDFSKIYGVYSTKGKAKTALLEHQRTFSLCSKLIGLEKGSGKCFQAQLGRCYGACVGDEPAFKYNLRVELALSRTKLNAWPYKDSVVIKHKDTQQKGLIVNQWRIVGELTDDVPTYYLPDKIRQMFDLDTYKILSSYIRNNQNGLLIEPI